MRLAYIFVPILLVLVGVVFQNCSPMGSFSTSSKSTNNSPIFSGSPLPGSPILDTFPPIFNEPSGLKIDLSYVDLRSNSYRAFSVYGSMGLTPNRREEFTGADAAYMYRLTGNASFGTLAVNLVDAEVNAAYVNIQNGRKPFIAGDSYYHFGDMMVALALTFDWCNSFLTETQKSRWVALADQAVFNVWNHNQETWGTNRCVQGVYDGSIRQCWSGWATDNPGNNYFYNFVEGTMYWALVRNRTDLIALLRDEKFPMLNQYFSQLPGGGSLEGTAYGTSHGRLFSLYHVWKESTGQDFANANTHARDSIRYWVHATMPTKEYFAPIGDQARVSMPQMFDYQRTLMLNARRLTDDSYLRDLSSWWLNTISVQAMEQPYDTRSNLLNPGSITTPVAEPLVYRAAGVGRIFARNGWDRNATWMMISAGKFNESHAHHDQGAFTLYKNSWLTTTENIFTHSGIEQDVEYNNVLRFENGTRVIAQRRDTEAVVSGYSATTSGDVSAIINLKPVYASEATIGSISRSFNFEATQSKLTIRDSFTVNSGTRAIFQVNVKELPTISGNVITAGQLRVTVISPANPTISIFDWFTLNPPCTNRTRLNPNPAGCETATHYDGYRIDISGSNTQYEVELVALP